MNKKLILVLVLLAGLLSTSCNSLPVTVSSDQPIAFSIKDINAVGPARNVNLGGEASLPDGVQLAVSAVRPLEDLAANTQSDSSSIYAILDRQFVTVEEGRWQAELALQESDDNGTSFESWQLDQAFSENTLKPSSQVLFMLTLEPKNFSEDIHQLLMDRAINDGATTVSYTPNGEAYLHVEKAIAVPIPSGNASVKDSNSLAEYRQTWEPRSQYNPTLDEGSDTAQTPFSEEDNLALPAASMLQ